MAGLVPAIHVLASARKDVDARDKPVHDGEGFSGQRRQGQPPWNPFIPTTSCINISRIPQVLGQFRLMWYLAGTSFDRHT